MSRTPSQVAHVLADPQHDNPVAIAQERRAPADVRGQAPFQALQRSLGNRAMGRLVKSSVAEEPPALHRAATEGTRGTGSPLPFLDVIQRAFGRHDVRHVSAYTGKAASRAADSMGAEAFAVGDRVAFAGQPSLRTAAHEAAHVVQQRAGVHLADNVGRAGDVWERHADAVADRVVRGQSAEGLLDVHAAPRAARPVQAPVQRLLKRFNTLYVPPEWADTDVTYHNGPHGVTTSLRTFLIGHHVHRQSVKQQLATALRCDNIVDVEVTEDLPDQITYSASAHKRRQAQSILKAVLRDPLRFVDLADGMADNPHVLQSQTRNTLLPKDLLAEPDDLNANYDIHKVCSLIAYIAAEGAAKVKSDLEGKGLNVHDAQRDTLLAALHEYYYNQQHIMYDDTSNRPALLARWGYKLLFAGNATWSQMLGRRDLFQVGKRYIFDLVGHTCCGWLLKQLPAVPGEDDRVTDYFAVHHDAANFAENELMLRIEYVYGK